MVATVVPLTFILRKNLSSDISTSAKNTDMCKKLQNPFFSAKVKVCEHTQNKFYTRGGGSQDFRVTGCIEVLRERSLAREKHLQYLHQQLSCIKT